MLKSHVNSDKKHRRPLSQSLSLNNLRYSSIAGKKEKPKPEPLNAVNSSKQKYKSLLLEDKENVDLKPKQRTPTNKRFSINFMRSPSDESEGANDTDKSTPNTSPFTQNPADSNSITLSYISIDDDGDKEATKRNSSRISRSSNLSHIMEFINQINYDFDTEDQEKKVQKVSIELELDEITKFNNDNDYNIKLAGNALIFYYDTPDFTPSDQIKLEDINYDGIFTEDYFSD